MIHDVQCLFVVLLCLVGNAQSQVADPDVLVGVDDDLIVWTINSLLDSAELLPELQGQLEILRRSLVYGKICDSLLKERMSSVAHDILKLLDHHVREDPFSRVSTRCTEKSDGNEDLAQEQVLIHEISRIVIVEGLHDLSHGRDVILGLRNHQLSDLIGSTG